MNSCDTITVEELSDNKDKYHILDVREEWELQKGTIEPSIKIPMNDVSKRINELPTDKPIIVVCRTGARSAQVTKYLASQGFSARNLYGGVLAWGKFADPNIQSY